MKSKSQRRPSHSFGQTHEEEKVEEAPKAIEDIELSEKKGKKEEEGEEGALPPGGKAAPEAKKEGKK